MYFPKWFKSFNNKEKNYFLKSYIKNLNNIYDDINIQKNNNFFLKSIWI